MTRYACLDCGKSLPAGGAHRCPICGGIFGLPDGITYEREKVVIGAPGIWRYRESFGLPDQAPVVTLGEGNTPLISTQFFGHDLHLKLESSNPSGSYKDRLAAVLVSMLVGNGIQSAVEDSSGNAGAAFAAYAARSGIRAKVYVPKSASGPKRKQIEGYGAEVVAVPGPRQAATDAVMEEVGRGAVYASHALQPHGLVGIATIAYELVEDLGQTPGAVIAPVGHGGLLLGIILGFQALLEAGEIDMLPEFVGVQAENNAPVWAAANEIPFIPGSTIAEGIAVSQPVHLPELLRLHRPGAVQFVVVEESCIRQGWEAFSRQGFYVEPTSAVVWEAFYQTCQMLTPPVVAVISGHGLKS